MKKILFLLLALIPLSVKANANYYIAIQDNEKSITYQPFEAIRINHIFYFKLSPFGTDDYVISDKNYVNNLAYFSIFDSTELFIATLQVLIWEHTTPNYDFYIVDSNYEVVDNSFALDRINQLENNLIMECEFMNNTYELNPNEELILQSPIKLSGYNVNDSNVIRDNYTIGINYTTKGTYVINFINKEIDISDNLIAGHDLFIHPFQITIIVDDYQDITISTYLNEELITNNISIYDYNNNLVKESFGKEESIRLKNQQYKFVDQITKEEKVIIIDQNTPDITFNHYNINGLKTDMPITKICQGNTCFSFTKKDNIYLFDTPLVNGYYEIYSNNEMNIYNLNNQENYNQDISYGLLYYITYEKPQDHPQNEESSDEPLANPQEGEEDSEEIGDIPQQNEENPEDVVGVIPDQEETSENSQEEIAIIPPDINIEVPNTEIALNNLNGYLVIIKKKEFV